MKNEAALDWLKGYQLFHLKKRFGDNLHFFRGHNPLKFSEMIDSYVQMKTGLIEEERLEMEIALKNETYTTEVLHTEYELLSHNRILRTVANQYILLNPDYQLSESIILGTIYSNEINAEIIPKPELHATFILFDGEFVLASLILAKLIAHSLPFKPDPPHLFFPIKESDLFEILVNNKENADRTILDLYCCLFHKPGNSPHFYSKSDLSEYIVFHLVQSIELFVFSHEMGHYRNGDMLSEPNKPEFTGEMKTSWHEEHFADLHGLNQVVKLYQENGQFISLLGPEIYFNFLILRERIIPEFQQVQSHPPSTQRLDYYRIYLCNFLSEEEQGLFRNFQDLVDLLFVYYHTLMIKVIDNFAKFKETPEYKELLRNNSKDPAT